MKKIIFYLVLLIIIFRLIVISWNKLTLNEDEEVRKFIEKVEILKTSNDFYHLNNKSIEYLRYIEENIDWFTPEQSKDLSKELNSLIDLANKKFDSINNEIIRKTEEEEKRKREEEEKRKREEEEKWMNDNWHIGSWQHSIEGLKVILDLDKNNSCRVYFINDWYNNLTYEKSSNKIKVSPINDLILEFNINNIKREIYLADGTKMKKIN